MIFLPLLLNFACRDRAHLFCLLAGGWEIMKSRESQSSVFNTPASAAKKQRQCRNINWSGYISLWLIVHKSSREVCSRQIFFSWHPGSSSALGRLQCCFIDIKKNPTKPNWFLHPVYQWFEEWKYLPMKNFMLFSLISLVPFWAEDI